MRHNFISQKLVEEVHIVVTETENYNVIMGSRAAVKGKGVRDRVNLKLGELMIVDSFLPLELRGVDVILGMQWLYTLSITEVDWGNLSMVINQDGQKIVLEGVLA